MALENKINETKSLFLVCFSIKQCAFNVWYIDSGCSNHMIGKLDQFINLNKSMTSRMIIGDGIICEPQEKVLLR